MVVVSASSLRVDPLTGDQVVVAPRRIPAPPAFGPGRLPTVHTCPFCPGNEAMCEPEIARVDGPEGWRARAFPNRRPGVSLEDPRGTSDAGHVGGRGVHEVLVLGREHGHLTVDERWAGLRLAAERLRDLAGDPGLEALGWYRNRGQEAGSSQPHDHAQIVGLSRVPRRLAAVWASQRAQPGLMDRLIERASNERRVVWADDHLVAYTAAAPQMPFEVHLLPRAEVAHLHEDGAAVGSLAHALHALVDGLDGMAGFTSHNLVGFFGHPRVQEGRWHVRLLPRLVPVGGFEWWSGGAMQPIEPRFAAERYRESLGHRT